jgi:DinB superfamily
MPEITDYYPKDLLYQEGETLEAVLVHLTSAHHHCIERLNNLSDEQFYGSASPDKWSPAQIGEHLVMVNAFLAKAIVKATAHYSDPSVRRIEMAKGQLTDDGRRIDPSGRAMPNDCKRSELIEQLHTATQAFIDSANQAAKANALDHDCMKQPFFGWMTCLETVQLVAWHIRHHTAQF